LRRYLEVPTAHASFMPFKVARALPGSEGGEITDKALQKTRLLDKGEAVQVQPKTSKLKAPGK